MDDDQWFLNGYNDSYETAFPDTGNTCDSDEALHLVTVLIPVMYSIAFVFGVLGNGVLLGILFRSRKNWSVTNTFILHLGVADILLLVTLPFWMSEATNANGWTFGTSLCKITGAVFTVNFFCGIFLLTCISLDRYLSIVHATQMYNRKKPWVVHTSCMTVWFFSLLLSIPDWIFLEAAEQERVKKTQCTHNFIDVLGSLDWQMISRLPQHILGFLLPSAIIIFCYSSILRRLQCGSKGLQKQKAFRVILALVGVFFICWTPYNITLMIDTLYASSRNGTCPVRASMEKAMVFTNSLAYFHCGLNPVLYALVGVKFRRQAVEILRAMSCNLRRTVTFPPAGKSRGASIWSDSAETSNSIVI